MRRTPLALAVLLPLAASQLPAQTLDPGSVRCNRFDDGSAENSWKVNNPTGSGDFFNLDLDRRLDGVVAVGVCVDTNVTGAGASDGVVGLYPDAASDASGQTPDLSAPFAELVLPTGGNTAGSCPSTTVFDTPDVTLSTSAHIGYTPDTGDSALWLCGDVTASNGDSYFTSSAYASPAIPFTINWMMGVAEGIQGGSLFINGGQSACVFENTTVTVDFFSGCPQPGLIGLLCANLAGLPPTYFPVVVADNNGNWSVTTSLSCLSLPFYPAVLCLQVLYLDQCSGSIKISNTVKLTIKQDAICGSGKVCFGQRDDGILDSTIWKVVNPSGSSDWFNVRHGGIEPTGGCSATSLEVASWDFCGSTQSWSHVGIYPTSTVNPGGGTPDIANPVSEVAGSSATMAPSASDWAYPATIYDVPDAALATTTYHAAVHWNPGDTCVWLGSDTTATNDDGTTRNCATLPGSTSYFSGDGYATNAVPFSTGHWMIKVNWN